MNLPGIFTCCLWTSSIIHVLDTFLCISRVIINPHALPMFREETFKRTKRKFQKIRADPVATKKPDRPLTGPGRGGKVGSNATQIVIRNLMKDETRLEDPREAFLKHAEAAKLNPKWVTPAYQSNQPVPVMAPSVYENEEEAEQEAKKKRPN